jgi:hypothetical protein
MAAEPSTDDTLFQHPKSKTLQPEWREAAQSQ